MNTEQIKEFGECRIGGIEIITIIGEIEGHEGSSGTAKTTKYEHLLPMLAAYDENSEIQGILFILNTIGGDVSCGLALAEMISGLKTANGIFYYRRQSFDRSSPCGSDRLFLYRTECDDDSSPGEDEWHDSWGTTKL